MPKFFAVRALHFPTLSARALVHITCDSLSRVSDARIVQRSYRHFRDLAIPTVTTISQTVNPFRIRPLLERAIMADNKLTTENETKDA